MHAQSQKKRDEKAAKNKEKVVPKVVQSSKNIMALKKEMDKAAEKAEKEKGKK